jgi:hypothetical protein
MTLSAIPGDSRPRLPHPALPPLPARKVGPEAPRPPQLASAPTITDRLAVCARCPKLKESAFCQAGPFFVRIKAKLAQPSCPLKKWDQPPIRTTAG